MDKTSLVFPVPLTAFKGVKYSICVFEPFWSQTMGVDFNDFVNGCGFSFVTTFSVLNLECARKVCVIGECAAYSDM